VSRRVIEEVPSSADERVAYGPYPSQFVDFRFPASVASAPLAINIHGGFWRASIDLTHAGHLCAAVTAAGFITANIEYRRVGEEGGGWPGTIDDVRRAVRFARGRFPGAPALLLGHSAGGHLALTVAAETSDLRAVLALGAVSNPRRAWELRLGNGAAAEFFGGSPDEFPERYAMGAALCPAILIHGTADDVVPVEMSRAFPDARLIEVPGGDHFDPIDPEASAFNEVTRHMKSAVVSM
jgi:acetyl esterase/lipase